MFNNTKIIATIGPSSESEANLKKLMEAGMDAVRLNFSHGTHDQFRTVIQRVRKLSKILNREISIIQDLQGPKIRVGEVGTEGVAVNKGDRIILSTKTGRGKNDAPHIPLDYANLPKEVSKGDVIFIDDGFIELHVESVNTAKTEIMCIVNEGGLIKNHKGINVPTASLAAEPLTQKDRRDLTFGMREGVDYVALSFVRNGAHIHELKKILRRNNSRAKVIAKIERHEAIANLEEIVEASDAVMVARGDLGIEIPAEQVPVQQKRIIHLCNLAGKPVMVATQMLASMVTQPRATRAEISDAATAIFDHADALVLSNETSVGGFPVQAVRTLAKVAAAVEREMTRFPHLLPGKTTGNGRNGAEISISQATCLNAAKLAHDIRARFIVAITRTGYTVREIAKYRPLIPMIVFTPSREVARQMGIVWGVKQTFVEYIHLDNPLPQIRAAFKKTGLAAHRHEIVVCNAGFGKKEKLITTTML